MDILNYICLIDGSKIVNGEDCIINYLLFEENTYNDEEIARKVYEHFRNVVIAWEQKKEVTIKYGGNCTNFYFQVRKVNNQFPSFVEGPDYYLRSDETIEEYLEKNGYEIVKQLEFGKSHKQKR